VYFEILDIDDACPASHRDHRTLNSPSEREDRPNDSRFPSESKQKHLEEPHLRRCRRGAWYNPAAAELADFAVAITEILEHVPDRSIDERQESETSLKKQQDSMQAENPPREDVHPNLGTNDSR